MKPMQMIFLLLFALPVFAAQHFSLEQSPAALLSAILSLALMVVFLGQVLARLKPGVARITTGMLLVTLLACYFFGQFLSYYLQGSYFNRQFYYHFNLATLTETWSVYWPLAMLFLAWLGAICLCFLYFRNHLDTFRTPTSLLTLLLVAALTLDPGLRQSTMASWTGNDTKPVISLSEIEWDRLKLSREALEQSSIAATAGKNLVLVFMEGLEKIYTEESLFPGLTPNLKRFSSEGWQLDNLFQVGGTEWTMGGLVSSLCGTPLLYDLGLDGNMVMFTGFLDRATCLPDVLAKAGYHQVFMGGASLDFAGKGEFLNAHSYNRVLGRNRLTPRLEDPDQLGGWGLYDESLFKLAEAEFYRLAALDRPFHLTVLTVDTHHPTGEPSPGCPGYPHNDNAILHAVHCTDRLLGDFINRLQRHPAWENTVVVLVSDHLGMRNTAYSLFPDDYERRLFFTAFNGNRQATAQTAATAMDLAPTILGLLDVQHNVSFLAGANLLQSENLTLEDMNIIAEREQAIRFINSKFLSSLEDEQLLFSLADARLWELDFSAHVTWENLIGGSLSFSSTGDDPFIILPELTIDSPQDSRIYVTLESDQASSFTLYFTTGDNPDYSEANTISHTTVSGENQLVFPLDKVARTGRLRIDPGTSPGRFLISSLEIRSIQ